VISLRSSEMASNWRGLCPAVDSGGLMVMMMKKPLNTILQTGVYRTVFKS
jgi:hypothetical protein